MKKIPTAIGPYSTYRMVGDFLFASGQLPTDPETSEFAGNTIETQTRQALENVQAILAKEGLTLDNVVKTTVFLKDMNDFAKMNEIYGSYFATPYPARSAVEVARLPKDALVEIEFVASR